MCSKQSLLPPQPRLWWGFTPADPGSSRSSVGCFLMRAGLPCEEGGAPFRGPMATGSLPCWVQGMSSGVLGGLRKPSFNRGAQEQGGGGGLSIFPGHRPAETRDSPLAGLASACHYGQLQSRKRAPPCTQTASPLPGGSAESRFPRRHVQLHFCCVMVGRGRRTGSRADFAESLAASSASLCWVKGQLSRRAGGSETSRKGHRIPVYHIVGKAPVPASQHVFV